MPDMALPVIRLADISLQYGKTVALADISLDIPAQCMVGLIGPDGVGKSSLLALAAGARKMQQGSAHVLGGDMRSKRHRDAVCPRIAYMPQGLGRNLYPTLSVEENLQFFARLFGHDAAERRRRIDSLTRSTGLFPFLARPVGKLSGGMKQKLGLCCALIHDPDLLILDEPTTGVDPLARAQFWNLIAGIRQQRPQISVIVATAYMDEAQGFDWLVAMDGGRVLATGAPHDLLAQTGSANLEAAFIALLPEEKKHGHQVVEIKPLALGADAEVAIEARDLTMRFGDFTAVDHVNFRIRRGEIFGFIGSNGCGKTTTMKVLTGLLAASEGQAWLFGHEVDPHDIATRRRVGYMSQSFSLYSELSVMQNLVLHARLFNVPEAEIAARVQHMLGGFGLAEECDALPNKLPLGMRQRLSLAVAMVHGPELLILDEPTSGVDPVARDNFWRLLIALSRRDRVTIFISTHFMNEAERCDRISLMHAGKVLVSDTPAQLVARCQVETLEQAFIAYLEEASGVAAAANNQATWNGDAETGKATHSAADNAAGSTAGSAAGSAADDVTHAAPAYLRRRLSMGRALSYMWRETLELRRDPVRATLALLGTTLLMFIIGYGMNMDVDNLSYAVLDQDQTTVSQNYTLNLAGSRYFIEKPPVRNHAELDRRMRNGELSLVLEIPSGFARDLKRGHEVQLAAWVDGAMPARAETVRGYVQAMHALWLADMAQYRLGVALPVVSQMETRFRYNPDVRSVMAMVPAVIPMLLMMIPAMLSALSVVREKELGSIINLYVTPVTRTEFLLGKQLPYIALAMFNFLILTLLAVTIFGVPLKGSFLTLTLAALLFVISSTGLGLLASSFTKSQISAMFVTMIGTILPCVQFAGLLNPVSSLEGVGAFIGRIYPATHFLTISRGVFGKALDFSSLQSSVLPLFIAAPVIVAAAILLLKKQES